MRSYSDSNDKKERVELVEYQLDHYDKIQNNSFNL